VPSSYKIRIYDASNGQIKLDGYREIAIAEDGTFTFNVSEGVAFVAVLVDPSAEFRKALGVIGISTGASQYWEQIATEQIEGNIVLGTIPDVPVGGILISENDISKIEATLTDIEAIKTLARIDDAVRSLRNTINGEPDISTQESYVFGCNDMGLKKVADTTPSPSIYAFAGFQIAAWINGTSAGNSVVLTPPDVVSLGDNPSTKLAYINGGFFQDHFEFGKGGLVGSPLIQECPEGYWSLSVDGTKRGEFDFAAVPPMSNEQISIPVPVLALTTRQNGEIIDSISIAWHIRNPNGGYDSVSSTFVQEEFGNYYLEICDYNGIGKNTDGGVREHFEITPTAVSIKPTKEWYVDNTGNLWAESFNVTYSLAGISARFVVRQK
jgi:hypothetical protein